jgi:hypothetical protein
MLSKKKLPFELLIMYSRPIGIGKTNLSREMEERKESINITNAGSGKQ